MVILDINALTFHLDKIHFALINYIMNIHFVNIITKSIVSLTNKLVYKIYKLIYKIILIMSNYIELLTWEFCASDELIIALETLCMLEPTVTIISSECTNNRWTYIVGVFNNAYLTKQMNLTFRSYLKSLNIKYCKYISIGIYGFTKKCLQYNTQEILKKYIELFKKNEIKIISYNTIYGTPLINKYTKTIGVPGIVSLATLVNPAYDTMLIFHVNNVEEAEKILAETYPIAN
jgi:hypothetical protein